jgi:hypothetical protein
MKGTIKLWLILGLLAGCHSDRQSHTTDRAFYYWKSVLDLSTAEKQAMDTLKAKKLYLKFFDIVWDGAQQRAMPVAQVRLTDSIAAWLQNRQTAIIPTVFITNECMQSIDSTQIAALAANIQQLIAGMAAANHLEPAIPEIQMDCDWTATSKNNYFSLLQHLQQQPFFKGKTLSATIRLYQCKYKLRTGIPPVDRGLLMCYNMGNLKNPATVNSIIEAAELKKYITNLEEYPLPLDIALPIFDWKVLYRNGSYKGLIRDLPDSLLQQKSIARQTGNTFTLLQDTLLAGYTCKQGDVIRKEDANFEEVIQSTQLLRSKLVTNHFTVVLFHLDSLTLHKYSTHELEEMFNSLH